MIRYFWIGVFRGIIMRGIILAAGRGSRLQQLTNDRPKCLVELSGKALLHWQLGAMRTAGVKRIMVVRGYLGNMITGDFQVCDNPHWQYTNMVASLMCVKDWLKDEPCIVSYSDIVYNSEAVSNLMSSHGDLTLLYDTEWLELWQKRFTDPLTDAESFCIDDNSCIVDIGRKNVSLSEIHGQYMGLLKLTPESARWIENLLTDQPGLCQKLDMTGLVSLLIQKGYQVKGIPWNGAWCEIDNAADLAVAEKMVDSGELRLLL